MTRFFMARAGRDEEDTGGYIERWGVGMWRCLALILAGGIIL